MSSLIVVLNLQQRVICIVILLGLQKRVVDLVIVLGLQNHNFLASITQAQ